MFQGKRTVQARHVASVFWESFLGDSPNAFKTFIVLSVILNTIVQATAGNQAASLALLLEFIITLVMALQCYPLQSGGLLVIHGFMIGLAKTELIFEELEKNLSVLLLLIFLVASIHFLKNVLFYIFTKLMLRIKNKLALSVLFLFASAVISTFLNALTVIAVILTVFTGLLGVFYNVVKNRDLPMLSRVGRNSVAYQLYPKVRKGRASRVSQEELESLFVVEEKEEEDNSETRNEESEFGSNGNPGFKMPSLKEVQSQKVVTPFLEGNREDWGLDEKELFHDMSRFRAFLRSLVMHAAVGTALGGNVTKIAEPQNLIVAEIIDWDFPTFIVKMLPVWLPTIPLGVMCCLALEKLQRFGYGTEMPASCRKILTQFVENEYSSMDNREFANLTMQVLGSLLLLIGLSAQVADVGILGVGIIVFMTSFNGHIYEWQVADAFAEAMPFAALIIVFFAMVAIIEENEVFSPVIELVISLESQTQIWVMYLANGALSVVSDNVFVATVFFNQITTFKNEVNSTITDAQYEKLAIAVISGTNLPSMATPNGQAAFLFILTSNLAPLVNLSYRKMCLMAAPYTLIATIAGLVVTLLL